MEEEILYRAKVKYNGSHLFAGDWVYGSVIKKIKGVFMHVIESDEFENLREFEVEIDPNTIGQFTGAYDEKGDRIFKGDKVAFTRGPRVVTTEHVVYHEPCICAFALKAPGSYIKLRVLKGRYLYNIVGNIYD